MNDIFQRIFETRFHKKISYQDRLSIPTKGISKILHYNIDFFVVVAKKQPVKDQYKNEYPRVPN